MYTEVPVDTYSDIYIERCFVRFEIRIDCDNPKHHILSRFICRFVSLDEYRDTLCCVYQAGTVRENALAISMAFHQ